MVTDFKNRNGTNHESSHTWKPKCRKLPDKQFMMRNSLLTNLIDESPHLKSVYHVFVTGLIGLGFSTIIRDYIIHDEINLGLQHIFIAFKGFHLVFVVWLAILTLACICYYAFVLWANVRIHLSPKSSHYKTIWDTIWLLLLLGYYGCSFRLASFIVAALRLPHGSAATIIFEQVRFLMKVHSFIRTNAEVVIKYKPHSEKAMPQLSFSKYIYFLFIPTLIYRNEYPRTREIRWKFVAYRALEIAGILLYVSFIYQRFFSLHFDDFGLKPFTWQEIVVVIFETSMAGLLVKFLCFYLIQHSIQNLFAELLRFGDRLFYEDWWTSTSFNDYFRTWNVLVHDWLYAFVYKDVYQLTNGNGTLAKLVVFILSAVVHEWVIVSMLGFFFPLLFTVFFLSGCSSLINLPRLSVLNVLFWYFLAFGMGGLISLYNLEYFARNNVAISVESTSLRNYLLPRWLTCDCIV